jgi:Holliday junction resolvase RusA-like endonuclease
MSDVRTQISELSIWVPLPPMELSKNGRAHWAERNRIYQEHRMIARAAINRVLPSGFDSWRGPVDVHINWCQHNQGHWPDRDNTIQRCAAFMDATEDAGLIANDRQIRSFRVDFHKQSNEGVSLTFTHEGAE